MQQEQVIQSAVGFYPELGKKIKNPFREDNSPKCYFAWDRPGTYIRLYDWSNSYFHRMNCFDMIFYSRYKRKISSEQDVKEATEMIRNISGGSIELEENNNSYEFQMNVSKGILNEEALRYYADYGISKTNLIEDQVFGVGYYEYNTRSAPALFKRHYPQDLAICLTRGSRNKIYRPYQAKDSGLKWKTDCTVNDIYWWNKEESEYVLGVGSHKDGRVLANWGFPTIALQSETAIPSSHILDNIFAQHKELLYIGDIDSSGIKNGQLLVQKLSDYPVKHLPLPMNLLKHNIKDVAELKKRGGPKRIIDELLLSTGK